MSFLKCSLLSMNLGNIKSPKLFCYVILKVTKVMKLNNVWYIVDSEWNSKIVLCTSYGLISFPDLDNIRIYHLFSFQLIMNNTQVILIIILVFLIFILIGLCIATCLQVSVTKKYFIYKIIKAYLTILNIFRTFPTN